ncbi:autotransporter domain-containing protein [Campylobacter fetus]|uniref:autotransporter domain-containing protein n=1 Tax=Campylobacter fetus TaxID=196 RepID=UPI00138E0588|nr:autotransporter domain-containing protein [Campylobacter fetus]
MSDTSGATHKLLLATSLVLINSLFAGEIVTYDPTGSGGGSTPGTAPMGIPIIGVTYSNAIAPSDTSPSDNVVTILSTDTSDVNYAFGGYSDTENVENNTVNISGGTINKIYGGHSNRGSANLNTVNISGGTINNNVYGGYIYSGLGSATKNTVTISGTPTFNNTIIVGGHKDSGSGDVTTGNTLNIKISNLSVNNIANFEFINFYLSGDAGKSDAILNLTNGSNTDISASKLSIGLMDNGNTPQIAAGSKIILIGKSSDSYTGLATVADDSLYKFDITKDGNNIIATLKNEVLVYNPENAEFKGVTHISNTTPGTITMNSHDIDNTIAPNSASPSDNVISIYSTNNDVEYIYGGYGDGKSATTSNNVVNLYGGTIKFDVYGGHAAGKANTADSNTINISGGTIERDIFGGFGISGTATNNTVNISGNPIFSDTTIHGGFAGGGDAITGNTLNIKTSNLSAKDIINFENINFYTSQDTTAGETLLNLTSVADVDISNSKIAVGVKQGDTPTLKVGDEITLIDRSNSAISNTINLPTNMMNNTSAIADMNSSYTFTLGGVPKDVTTPTDISKLVAVFGVTTYNPGNVAAANGTIYYSNTAPGTITINSSTTNNAIAPSSTSLNDNIVNIYSTSSKVDNVFGGYSDTQNVERNTVNIYDGTISNISGGYSESGSANSNTINISGGTISNIYGSYSGLSSSNLNTINISGGIINENVYGGSSRLGSSNLNTINISGGTILNVIGGSSSSSGSATNNTINISGNPMFRANTIIVGGYKYMGNGDVTTGNTLNIKTSKLSVKDIANFEFINFYLDKSIKANDTLLTLSDDTKTGTTDLSNSKIGVGVISGDTPVLNSNDKIILIDKPNGSLTKPNDMSNNIKVMQGISNSYEFTLSTVDSGGDIKQIVASLTPPSTPVIIPPPYVPPTPITPVEPTEPDKEPEPPVIPTEPDPTEPVIEPEVPVQPVTPYTINEKQKSVLEGGFVSSLMLNNSNQALESGLQDMSQALNASGANETSIGNTNVSSTRNKTGSHVDVKSISLLVGFAKKANDSFMYSAFFEAGFGNYDSYNNFSTGDIKGSGDSSYYGFGVLSKFDMINNYYFENSLRVGQIKSDFSSDDFGIATPISSSFDSKRYYIGAHIGLGKVINLNNSSNLDIYTKVFYTRVDSEDITMSTNDRFRLDAINSVSAKLGFLYNYELKENLSLYSGASFSKEFNAEAKGRNISYNYDLDSPSMKGNTRSLEAGIKLKPISNNDKLSLDLGIVGLVGKSEGVSGKFGFKWKL